LIGSVRAQSKTIGYIDSAYPDKLVINLKIDTKITIELSKNLYHI